MTDKTGKEVTRKKASSQPSDTPTGTVTFLFTDIEGSTVLWENHPAQMQEALARHDEILRAAVEASGGYLFKTIGDACCAAFATPRQALEATLAAQRALYAEPWDENVKVRVRMALHTGVAEERDGDYFGPPVNRVARLLSTGHGGQILLSAVSYGLVRDALVHLEPEAELRDLGEHRLKDLRYTEHIFQLAVPDLPADFPPLKTHGLVTPAHSLATPAAPSLREEHIRREAGVGDERYRRIRLMGSGGMAEVYLAHDEVLDRDVALKVLRKQYADDEQFVKRFEREAKSAGSLSHPNIVAIHDLGETEDGAYYIVMEYMPGGTLKERILKEGALSLSEAIEVTSQIAQALQVAHRRDLVHRDIKPQNVLLNESGQAKVADFGIARAASSTTITKTGVVMGTAHYVSPEQALGEPASPQSDLYSLGVVLYEMLTGEVPYDAETPVGIAMKHISGQLRPPKELNPAVSEGINAVCVRLMAKDPKDRYQDAAELLDDLERVRRGESPTGAAQHEASNEVDTVVDKENTVADGASALMEPPSGGPVPAGQPGQPVKDSPVTVWSHEVPNEPAQLEAGQKKLHAATTPSPPRPRDHENGENRRRRALPWVLGLIGVVAIAGIGIAVWLLLPDSQGEDGTVPAAATVALPDVVGISQDKAEGALRAGGFKVTTKTRESSIEDDGKVVKQDPSGGEADKSSVVEITIGAGPLQATPGYDLVKDDTGNLAVEVPSEWSDRRTGDDGTFTGERTKAGKGVGPSITATTDVFAFENDGSSRTPGTYAVASKKLAREYTEDQLVHSGFNDRVNCNPGALQKFNRPPYSGNWQTWTCPSNGGTYFTLAAAPEGRECVVMLQVATYGKDDEQSAHHILDTFQVDCGELP